jgi:hypothetical protein
MKALLGIALLVAIGAGIYLKYPGATTATPKNGVRIGATVEEVEKVLGPPLRVLPSFGRENRFYKAKSGQKYMLIFEGGELIEIH